MKSVGEILDEKIRAVMASVTGQKDCAAVVGPATEAKFGDYQANGVMALAKKLKANPRKLAEEVVKKLNLSDICESPEVAGPGFINLRLKADFVADRLLQISKDSANIGVEKTAEPKTIVVDFSAPNIAKQMHVGHLRSTIIGDCICRTLEFLGHRVIRQNHIGDWGTPMGMVAFAVWEYGFKSIHDSDLKMLDLSADLDTLQSYLEKLHLDDVENYYKAMTKLEKEDPQKAEGVREFTAKLQAGNRFVRELWDHACDITLKECYNQYQRLNVTLREKDTRGESTYKDDLPDIVLNLQKQGLAKESDGAVCVFPEGFKNKDGEPLPFIIQKSDGAYLYATTDLAALRYRLNELKADRIIYVTDARQKLHFEMLFAVARMAGWDERQKTEDGGQKTEEREQKTEDRGQRAEFVHVIFGSVLGENGQPLKTREGENVKLKDLLDEAVVRAREIVEEKNPDLSAEQKEKIAKAVGIGAVKYADFSNNRTSDYIFSFDKMLAMDGNTAPYMQYAYARIKSIERKAQTKDVHVETELGGIKNITLTEPAELDLAKHLIRYGEAIQSAAADYRPNYLTTYLYELAQKFSVFYTNCPVLDAGSDKRPTRLLLCDLTANTIRHGLQGLLGIEVIEQM